jgi:FSR family fosmidomycin resistance protein-like MFS transporter
MRAALHLSYTELGLLAAVSLVLGSLLEMPVGLVAGEGRRRHYLVLAGGLVLGGSLALIAFASGFWILLAGLVLFFPASGAFVSLTQAALMDAEPDRQQQRMASWNFAGAAGAVCGPLLLVAVLTTGGSWRTAYLLLAGLAGTTVAAAAVGGPARRVGPAGRAEVTREDKPEETGSPGVMAALHAIREFELVRWLLLLEISDLLLDVLTGFLGVYLVDVEHASPALAAVGVAIRLAATLAGDALFVPIAHRVTPGTALRWSVVATGILYPAFLLVPSLTAKLIVLAALSIATACWYPVAMAGLYGSLPGRSGIAVFWSSASGLAGAAGPLAVGVLAQAAGLTWALAALAIAPVAIFVLSLKSPANGSRKV